MDGTQTERISRMIDAAARDMTAHERTEAELIKTCDLLEQAGQMARVGAWEVRLADQTQWWSAVTKEIHEVSTDFTPDVDTSLNFYKEGESRDRITAAVTRAIQNGEPFDLELQIVTARGHVRWIRAIGKTEFSNGQCTRLYGAFQDINEQRQADDARHESEEKFRQIAENVGEVFWLRNADNTQMLYITPAYQQVWGRSCQSLYENPQSFMETILDADKAAVFAAYEQYGRTGCFDMTYRIVRPDGKIRWLHAKSSPIKDANGTIIRHTGLAVDITERMRVEEELLLQTRLQKMLMEVSSTYISLPLDQVDEAMETSLGELGAFVAADRVYLFDYDFAQQICRNTHEWCAQGITPQIHELQAVPLAMLPEWVETHQRGATMHIRDVAALPPESGARQILEPQGIKSLIAVPMLDGERCLGFVGFDSVRAPHHYSDAEQRLLTVFAQMLVNVRKRREIERALQEATEQARAASKAKSEFLANMSHEIRTPLNGVIGFTDLLLKTPLNSVQQQYAQHAYTSGQALVGIINDILDLSKIEAGKLELDIVETDIIELIEQAADIIKYHAGQKGLELLLNIAPTMPRLAAVDPIRLKQILINLLNNAIKFTEKGEVELKVEFAPLDPLQGRYTISVRDTGIGITAEQRQRLFKAFSQADSSTTRRFGGTGLGLTISNLLAEKMGGQIEVDSVHGSGSRFYFSLETRYAHAEKARDRAQLPVKRVLVIDDNENNRLLLEHNFAHWGIEYTGCDNGLTGIQLLRESGPFDLLIVDFQMPLLDGIQTIRRIREDLQMAPAVMPTILLHSSADDQMLRAECQKWGVQSSLVKPVKAGELYHLLQNIGAISTIATTPSVQPQAAPAPVKTVRPVTILVAEDVATNMLLARILISRLLPNAEIISASNGIQAVQAAQQYKIDLILMDVQMPELDGLDATRLIREQEQETQIRLPIVALTAGALNEERERCLASGMDDFLAKPIQAHALHAILKHYLSDVPTQPPLAI